MSKTVDPLSKLLGDEEWGAAQARAGLDAALEVAGCGPFSKAPVGLSTGWQSGTLDIKQTPFG